jgi:hypothetical protein
MDIEEKLRHESAFLHKRLELIERRLVYINTHIALVAGIGVINVVAMFYLLLKVFIL